MSKDALREYSSEGEEADSIEEEEKARKSERMMTEYMLSIPKIYDCVIQPAGLFEVPRLGGRYYHLSWEEGFVYVRLEGDGKYISLYDSNTQGWKKSDEKKFIGLTLSEAMRLKKGE